MINPEYFGELMLLPQAVKIYRNKYLRALRHSFFTILPFLLAVSVLDIVDKNIISPEGPVMSTSGLNLGYWLTGGLTGEAYRQHELIRIFGDFQIVVKLGYGTVSIMITAALAERLGVMWDLPRETSIVTAVVCYFMFSPMFSDGHGWVWVYLSSRSFFSALFSAFFATWCLSRFVKINRFTFAPPDYLPEILAERLPYFIPFMLTLSVTVVMVLVLMLLRPHMDSAMASLMGRAVFQSPLFAIFYQFFVWGLWWIGIPGYNFTANFHDTVFPSVVYDAAANPATVVFTDTFFSAGIIHILGLIIAILTFSRHRTWRKVSLVGLPFILFNVEELFVFGLPIILNPIFVIPFLIAPLANTVVGWAAISWGIVPSFQIFVPPTVPIIFNGVMSTHSVMGGVLQVVWLIMDIFIYAPFIITANMFMLSDEATEGGESK